MDWGRSHTSQEEDEGRRASKKLRVTPQVQEKEVVVQPEPQAWLPALMLHGEPLMDDASLRDFNKGEGTYVVDTLERSLLLPADMAFIPRFHIVGLTLKVLEVVHQFTSWWVNLNPIFSFKASTLPKILNTLTAH